jgi:hypothetical protein
MIYLSLRESGIYFNNHNKQVSEFAIEIQKLKRKKRKKELKEVGSGRRAWRG